LTRKIEHYFNNNEKKEVQPALSQQINPIGAKNFHYFIGISPPQRGKQQI
jgi:hypothetical protein